MTYETKPQSSELHQDEEDTNVITTDFKKVGHLDIAVICSICEGAVHINKLFHHKKAHQAQAVLDYQRPWTEPIDINKISFQRKQLILRMKKADKFTEREREKIGCSFDLLKETLKIAPYFHIKSVAQSSVHIEVVSNPLIKAIAICQDKNVVWHTDLEDVFVVLDNYGNRKGTCFLGVFDGTNGISAAQITSAELPLLFLDQLSLGDPSYEVSEAERKVLDSFHTIFRADYKVREKDFTFKRVKGKISQLRTHEWIHRAYAKSFWRMDRLLRLGRNEVSRVRWSSCAAVTCLVERINNEKEKWDQERNKIFEKQHDVIQQEEEVPEKIIGAKEKSNTEQGSGNFEEQQKDELSERTNAENEQKFMQQEEMLEEISNTDQTMGSVVDECMEESTERMNEEKAQTSIEKDMVVKELSEVISKTKRKSSTERTSCFIEQQREKPTERMNEQEQNIAQQEELLEGLGGVKREHNRERGTGSTTVLWLEEPTETLNEEKRENLTEVEKELTERIERAKGETDMEEETGSITEQQTERPIERINEEKDQNAIKQEDLPGDLSKAKRKSSEERGMVSSTVELWREESTEKVSEKNEQNIIHEDEELSERIIKGKEKGTTKEQQQKPLEIINDAKEECITELGGNEQSTSNKDGIEEESLLENCPNENSVGVLHIANIGNVHAVLCKDGKSYWLTKEHSTYCGEEKIRILQNGGYISRNEPKGLVEGLIKNTRGLGHHGNPKLKKTFIPVPHTISFPVDDSCQFLILATNGLWEVLDKNEVVLLTLILFSAYLEKYQHDQLKKSSMPEDSTSPARDLKDEFYSWYSNQDFFPEDINLNQDNVRLMAPTNDNTKEKEIIQSGSFRKNSEEQESESSLEPPFMDLSFSEDTTESDEKTPSASSTEEDPKEAHKSSETSEDSEKDSCTFHALAAKYISKHLVKAALKAGSRDNITVLVALLNGCDKIPMYVYQ
uniref:Protein phosphatase 2C-like domain-containing protein 1 n=1 Tax=Pogona vitticeps TaxID=103695 RepID=A0A6J0UQR5_9SAUR